VFPRPDPAELAAGLLDCLGPALHLDAALL
jgi:hypothetical protein